MGGEGYCEELSLELSIGGKYGKESENLREKSSDLCGPNANCKSRCDFSESIDAQRRREIQASRRQEARRKREEKVRKSRGVNNVVGFVDDKLFLEEQRLRERARDREIRENDLFCAGKNGGDEPADELGLSLFSDEKKRENGCLYPNVQLVVPKSDSDYRSISHKAETEKCHKLAPTRSPDSSSQVSSGGEAPEAAPGCSPRLPQMPCVSATGDGPNGRTVIGFLYKYDKREVSIMCVCHGSSFSPAEFVEHAGGVDVSHPLRHITVVT